MMNKKRPKLFISYAHKDGMDFTRRIAFALEMYMDIFWDRRLQAGEFPTQLEAEIESSDYLLYIMTPYSIVSEWCKREIDHALKHEKKLLMARIYTGEHSIHEDFSKTYTYSDFTEDFEAGFRRICAMILGQPYSSWEHFGQGQDDNKLIETMKSGIIPGIISKEIAVWVIAEHLWQLAQGYAETKQIIFVGKPRTPLGVVRQCMQLLNQFTQSNDVVGFKISEDVKQVVEPKLESLILMTDNNHQDIGLLGYEIIEEVRNLAKRHAVMHNNTRRFMYIDSYLFEFDIAEKLRELINIYARRSRYLY